MSPKNAPELLMESVTHTKILTNTRPDVKEAKPKKLSEICWSVFNPSREETTFGEIVKELDHHGMAIVLILFSAPSALPIPAPGYSTLLSIPLMLIGLRLVIGSDTVWLPESLSKKSFKPASFQGLTRKILRLVSFIEKFTKPRFSFLAKSRAAMVFVSLLICCLAASMALPIPGTNTLPAGGIFLIGFSMLEDDGLLMILGVIYSIIALCITTFIIFFGYSVVKAAILGIM